MQTPYVFNDLKLTIGFALKTSLFQCVMAFSEGKFSE